MLLSQPDVTILKTAYLLAPDSPRQAFYLLWLEKTPQGFRVGKVSGAGGRVWHRQTWEFATLAQAEALFHRRLREKTNPHRRSRRRYRLSRLLSKDYLPQIQGKATGWCPAEQVIGKN